MMRDAPKESSPCVIKVRSLRQQWEGDVVCEHLDRLLTVYKNQSLLCGFYVLKRYSFQTIYLKYLNT